MIAKKVKTDCCDAQIIATRLAHDSYSSVYVPMQNNEATGDFIHQRNEAICARNEVKQQILSACLGKNDNARILRFPLLRKSGISIASLVSDSSQFMWGLFLTKAQKEKTSAWRN